MIVYKDYTVFTILGEELILISSETAYGRSTVAEIADELYYLDDEPPTIASAIMAFQELYGHNLSPEELKMVMEKNKAISGAI